MGEQTREGTRPNLSSRSNSRAQAGTGKKFSTYTCLVELTHNNGNIANHARTIRNLLSMMTNISTYCTVFLCVGVPNDLRFEFLYTSAPRCGRGKMPKQVWCVTRNYYLSCGLSTQFLLFLYSISLTVPPMVLNMLGYQSHLLQRCRPACGH